MPKTIEELEKELATMKGELVAKQQQLDTQISQNAHATLQLKEKDEKLAGFQKVERDRIVAEVHAIDKSFDVTNQSNEILEMFVTGFKKGQANGQSITPPTDVPHGTQKAKVGDKKISELEQFYNS